MSRTKAKSAWEVWCVSKVVVWPGPEKITPYLARFIRSINSRQVERETPVSASIRAASSSTPLARARRRPECLEFLAGLDGEELVGHPGGCGFLNVDHDAKPVLAASRHKQARGFQAVPAQVARMALNRVAAPEDDQIAAVPDFTERARDLAHLLQCQNRRAMRDAVRRVDAGADPVADRHGRALGLRGCLTEAEDDRVSCLVQDLRGPFDAIVQRARACPRSNRPALARYLD